jgi:hypothetical protein
VFFFAAIYGEASMQIQRSFLLLARTFIAATLLGGIFAAPSLLAAQQPYHVIDRWKIGGEGGGIT